MIKINKRRRNKNGAHYKLIDVDVRLSVVIAPILTLAC